MKSVSIFFCVFFLIFSFLPAGLLSQEVKAKFGKIGKQELETTVCPIDSNAHAYYIFDVGESYFDYGDTKVSYSENRSSTKGFQLKFKRHFRIKILDKEAFDFGDIRIRLYRSLEEETVSNIRAITYNLEKGKIVKHKLDKKDIFREETSKHWYTKKFAMPNVREGSVIEVEYMITSDFYFNLQSWNFQSSIPVLWSEYYVAIPEYYHYNHTQKGYHPIQFEQDAFPKELRITTQKRGEGVAVKATEYTNTYRYIENAFTFKAKNIPAFPYESFLRTRLNYISRIEFELEYTHFSGSDIEYYTTSWELINKDLMNHNYFGLELKRTGHLKALVESLNGKGLKGFELMNEAFQQLKQRLAWNGSYHFYLEETMSKAFKEGGGNCADINLNLVGLLRDLGFDAYPVLVSTKGHGIIHPAHPSLYGFNYVIALVWMDGKTFLMDATDPYAGINLLPVRCLNDKGRIVNLAGGDWINLMNYRSYDQTSQYKLSIDDNLEVNGSELSISKDYAAYQNRKKISSFHDLDDYKRSREEYDPDLTIEELEVEGLDDLQKDLSMTCRMKKLNHVESSGDILFFRPILDPFFNENPFKMEKRDYPVEFDYPYEVKQLYSYTIPENWEVSESPSPLIAKLPDNSAKFVYQITTMGNSINVTSVFSTNKSVFLPEEYEHLQQFCQLMIEKQNEMVVLKMVP